MIRLERTDRNHSYGAHHFRNTRFFCLHVFTVTTWPAYTLVRILTLPLMIIIITRMGDEPEIVTRMGNEPGIGPIVTLTTPQGLEDDEVLSCVMQSLAVAPLLDIASDMDIQVNVTSQTAYAIIILSFIHICSM